jgi:hypothetical protein
VVRGISIERTYHYFQEKVTALQNSLPQLISPLPNFVGGEVIHISTLSSFTLCTCNMLRRIITFSHDVIPTWVLKRCLKGLLPSITAVVNLCITYGLPSKLKHAVINPTLKSNSKFPNDLSSYRPISNLPFISKIVEKSISQQITEHLNKNNLFDQHQFAYRSNHSCELALLTLTNFIYSAADEGEVTVIIFLDMSAAFDTVQHDILIERLQSIGVRDQALLWLTQYLQERTSAVTSRGLVSPPLVNSCGVPQGSVLGPLLFIIYISAIDYIVRQQNVCRVSYADDIQLFATAKTTDIITLLNRIQTCIFEISQWLASSRLVFNASKTELLICGTRQQLSKLPSDIHITIDGVIIKPSQCVRDPGIWLDPQLTMKAHVRKVM